jgi:hypothetical protein
VGSTALFLGLILYAGTLVLIRSWINATPARLRAIAKQERERDERRDVDALQEATAVKVGTITRSLRDHEEQIAADLRAQVAAAETRARMAEARARGAEREASEATSMLAVVSELLRDVRATHQGLGELPALVDELRAMVAKAGPRAPAAPPDIEAEEARQTVEMKAPASGEPPPDAAADDDDAPDEEMTKVAERPAAHLLAAPSSSGLRLAPARAAVPPPASGRGGAS